MSTNNDKAKKLTINHTAYNSKDLIIDFVAGGLGGIVLVFICFPIE